MSSIGHFSKFTFQAAAGIKKGNTRNVFHWNKYLFTYNLNVRISDCDDGCMQKADYDDIGFLWCILVDLLTRQHSILGKTQQADLGPMMDDHQHRLGAK